MKIIKILSIISLLLLNINVFSQKNTTENDDVKISLTAFIPDQVEGIPDIVRNNLLNKLNTIVTQSGISGGMNERFVITAVMNVISKDVVGVPVKTSINVDLTLFIGDGYEGTKFSSTTLSISGVGNNETQAYIQALNKVNARNQVIQNFINTGKIRIIDYYNSKCDIIIKEAQNLASRNEFQQAIQKLTSVPSECKECYSKSMDNLLPIYQKEIDRQCQLNIAKAKNIWASKQDANTASEIANFLYEIEPNSKCYNEAKLLSDNIAKRVREQEKREWDFKMKVYSDQVDIQKQTIKAARDIGVAYGNNQPKTVVQYNIRGWYY